MRIGELAKRTGVSIRSLRYYELQGLLSSDREENGYRVYSELAVEQVNTIQFYIRLGLSTEEIAGFLHCVLIKKEAFCEQVLPVYRNKLEQLDRQIAQLEMIRANLKERIAHLQAEATEATTQ
ncbi:MerR family transcriptional regulator [Paenibacillus koleovorans]|uniref:MerR family transcriptional regulator n=1 Tax=Paenibacillus koleovorans TaxID=121608 RepID=UPI000FDC0BA0|nr:MerR family transcriptional regulator [Paenibacillus koleovorans]